MEFNQVLKNATPYWIIIAAGATEQGRIAVFEYIDSSTNLGYASHFMTDVGNPLHTGAELRQTISNGYITPTRATLQITGTPAIGSPR